MSNVPRNSVRLIAHTFGVVFLTVVTCGLLYKTYWEYVKLRQGYKSQKMDANYTAMITGIPRGSTTEDVENYFRRLFPNEFVGASLIPNIPGIVAMRKKRFQLLQKLEREKAIELKTGKRREVRPSFWSLRKVDAIDYYQSQIDEMEDTINDAIRKGNPPSRSLSDSLEGQDVEPNAIKGVLKNAKGFADRSRLAVVEHLRPNEARYAEKSFPPTRVAFVQFNSIPVASFCSQTTLNFHIGQWVSNAAPEPEDVKWSKLHVTRRQQILRGILVFIALVALIFFWTVRNSPIPHLIRFSDPTDLRDIPLQP